MIKIKNRVEPKFIKPTDMRIGMVGVIVGWSVRAYIGTVIMKINDDDLICLDPQKQAECGGWTGVSNFGGELLVEVLPVGTVIEITLK